MSAPNLALVAVVHGRACVLYMDAREWITEHIAAVGEVVALEECGEWPPSVEGSTVLVCTLGLVDDGPGDWPGFRECRLDATGHRHPTPEEWGRHLAEEHLWRTVEQVAADPEPEPPVGTQNTASAWEASYGYEHCPDEVVGYGLRIVMDTPEGPGEDERRTARWNECLALADHLRSFPVETE